MPKRHRGSSPPFQEPEFDFDGPLPDRVFTPMEPRRFQARQDIKGLRDDQPLIHPTDQEDESRWQNDGGKSG